MPILAAGCKSPAVEMPDSGQSAICTFFLPSGNQQPPCHIDAGDLALTANGHIRVTLQNQGNLTFDQPMEFQIQGGLAPGIFRFAQLLSTSRAGFTLSGDSAYLISPMQSGAMWGDAVVDLTAVDPLPAQAGDTIISIVSGLIEMTFASYPVVKETVKARVSF